MINNIWFYMIVLSLMYGIFFGDVKVMTEGILDSSIQTVELCIQFIGVWALWLGLMEIVKKSGLIDKLSARLYPVIKLIFPDIPKGHEALGSISLNFSANMLGLGNAATPFGLQAMKQLQSLNEDKETTTDAMCMFLVINTSSIQLIPTTIIAIRASLGSANPTSIVLSALIATTISTFIGILSSLLYKRKYASLKKEEPS
ncbi:MAG: nucleoside recognition domain-containing protein [Eubacteriales bacterium]